MHPIYDYISLKEDLMSIGYEEEEAAHLCRKTYNKEVERNQRAKVDADRGVYLRHQISMEDILRLVPNWYQIKTQEKKDILWELGLNTKSDNPSKKVFFYDERIHKREDGKIVYGKLIYGNERIDEEWLKKRIDGKLVSTFAAQTYERFKNDPSYEREIRKMEN